MDNQYSKGGAIELLIAMIIMGTVGLFVIESQQSVYNVVFYRCLLGVCFLFFYCLIRRKLKKDALHAKNLLLIIISGVFLVSNWLLLFEAFKSSSISTATTIYHAQPFFFLVIWSLLFKEKIPLNKVLWMILAFIGVAMVADLSIAANSLSADYLLGTLLALAAAMLWALSAVLVKLLRGVSPFIITLIQLAVGTLVLLPFADFSGMSLISHTQWGYLIILGIAHTCLTYILMYSSYTKLPAATIAAMTFIYPGVAIFVDYYFYNHSLNTLQALGAALIFFSSYASTRNIHFPAWIRKRSSSHP
ncbi:MAG TPA: DMT family transporter [Alcaligenes sp.]|nr:DMT family transporter [Alcaligenes sp.]HRL27677.1 DMT family transporter [Alcaligenes sp.]